jgi:hypothetical protein
MHFASKWSEWEEETRTLEQQYEAGAIKAGRVKGIG